MMTMKLAEGQVLRGERLTMDAATAKHFMQLLEQRPGDLPKLDRLIDITAMREITGWSRTTILNAEGLGHLPRRRKLPNGKTAFLASEITEWMRALPMAPLPNVEKEASLYIHALPSDRVSAGGAYAPLGKPVCGRGHRRNHAPTCSPPARDEQVDECGDDPRRSYGWSKTLGDAHAQTHHPHEP